MTRTDTTTGPPLAERARHAVDAYRAADPDTFADRHAHWPRWTRRATSAHAVAAALDVTVDAVTVTDDDTRAYGISGQYPGDLITVTDPASGGLFRFLPDPTAHGHGWLLLGPCANCAAPVPVARVATLADLGADLDNPMEHLPPECDSDPAHDPTCPHARHLIEE